MVRVQGWGTAPASPLSRPWAETGLGREGLCTFLAVSPCATSGLSLHRGQDLCSSPSPEPRRLVVSH